MGTGTVRISRKTRETDITLELDLLRAGTIQLSSGLPFFDHLLHAMSFHGGFSLTLAASGDLEVDPHHLVEDVGLVLGDALRTWVAENGTVARYGNAVIPMDDALSQAVIDVCERPYLVFEVQWPQERSGSFEMSLLTEFFNALSSRARINLHLLCRYGRNSHHMAESLFKALGRAIHEAYTLTEGGVPSTKGTL